MMGFGELKDDDKKVEYLELIYDLIFVFVIGRNNSLIQYIHNGFIRGEVYLTYIVCTLIVIQIWSFTTFFVNRYGSNGTIEHIGMFVNMYLLYYVADGTRVHWEFYVDRYGIAWGLILINIAFMYYVKLKKQLKLEECEIKQIKWNIIILLSEAFFVFISIPIYKATKVPFFPFAMVLGMIGSYLSSKVNSLVEIDFNHLTERAMLFVVFTFGEMIITLEAYFEGGFSFNNIYFSIMAFLIVIGLLLSYGELYDHLIDRNMKTTGIGYMLIHVVLIFALNNISTALDFMQDKEVSLLPKALFMVGSLLLYYICLFMVDRFSKERLRPDKKFLVMIVAVIVGFVAMMLAFYKEMYLNIAVSVLFVFTILWMIDRFWKSKEHYEKGSKNS